MIIREIKNNPDKINGDFETMIDKPKITTGEWRVGNYRPYRQVVQIKDKSTDNDSRPGNRKICDVNVNGNRKENAKAISTVPEMIDVLIESYNMVTQELAEETAMPTDELVELATMQEKVLEKAGCKFL